MDRGAQWATVHGVAKSQDMTECLNTERAMVMSTLPGPRAKVQGWCLKPWPFPLGIVPAGEGRGGRTTCPLVTSPRSPCVSPLRASTHPHPRKEGSVMLWDEATRQGRALWP